MYGQNYNYQQPQQYGRAPYQQQGYQQAYGQYPQQQTQSPAQPRMSAQQMLDALDSQSSKGAFNAQSQPGTTVSGVIEAITASQVTDFGTRAPLFWNDGSPKLQILVTIDTGMTDPSVEDDDGRRTVYIKGWGVQKRAWQDALRRAGLHKNSDVKPGDRLTVTFTGYGEQGNAPQPPKLYEYVIEHMSAVDRAMGQHVQNGPQPGAYAPQPPAPQYGQPVTLNVPQAGAPAVPQPQPTTSGVDERQVRALHAAGKAVPEIQTLTGWPAGEISRIVARMDAETAGGQGEPEF